MLKTDASNKSLVELVQNIISYINFLKTNQKLSLSIHFRGKAMALFHLYPALSEFSSHNLPYCMKIKRNAKLHRKCLRCQNLVIKKCGISPSFFGVCHAGIGEYICGIFKNEKCTGFISVSGYFGGNSPDFSVLDAVIPPLKNMIERLIEKENLDSGKIDTEYIKILNYVRENYRSITLSEICSHFYTSASYISHIFKKNNGKSIKAYANALKIENAKQLLKSTNESITDIAFMCGFCDIGYFSKTFRKITGTSPRAYRTSTPNKPPVPYNKN